MNAAARDADAGPARTVLVVEDEPLVRETIVCELEDAGFGVLEAETAETGLTILKQRPVSLLFTDIRLPGSMDGWGLAEAARASSGDSRHLCDRLHGRGTSLGAAKHLVAETLPSLGRARRHREADRRARELTESRCRIAVYGYLRLET